VGSGKRFSVLDTISYLRTHALLPAFVCVTFLFHFRNLFDLGPTWDDWYYPKNFNTQLQSFNPDFDSFSTGYGLGGFTFVEVFTRLMLGNFNVYSEDNFSSLVARRAVLLVLCYVGALATYGVMLSLGYSRNMAKVAVLLLLTLPNWVGQGSINIKDIPVAVGLIMLVDAFIRVIKLRSERVSVRIRILVFGEIFVGFFLSFGTRFGLIVFILLALSIVISANRSVRTKKTGISNFSLVAPILLSYLMLLPLNPILINPIKFLPKAIFGTLSLYQQPAGPVLTNGNMIDGNNPPIWYLPTWTFAQMPVTHFCLLVIGIFALIKFLYRSPIRHNKININQLQFLTIFILMTFGPYLSAIFLSPPLYDGDRQFLMAYPFFVLLMVAGMSYVNKYVKNFGEVFLIRFLIIALCLSPGISIIGSTPFTYSFRNEVIRSPEKWEGDYMGVSLRRAVQSTANLDYQLAYDFSDERWLVVWNQTNIGKSTDVQNDKFLYIATRRGARISIPNQCIEIENIKTNFLGRENILSFVALCKVQKVGNQ
jgi:hypothetical protein